MCVCVCFALHMKQWSVSSCITEGGISGRWVASTWTCVISVVFCTDIPSQSLIYPNSFSYCVGCKSPIESDFQESISLTLFWTFVHNNPLDYCFVAEWKWTFANSTHPITQPTNSRCWKASNADLWLEWAAKRVK